MAVNNFFDTFSISGFYDNDVTLWQSPNGEVVSAITTVSQVVAMNAMKFLFLECHSIINCKKMHRKQAVEIIIPQNERCDEKSNFHLVHNCFFSPNLGSTNCFRNANRNHMENGRTHTHTHTQV